MMYILVPIWLLSWVILFPVDSVGVDVPGKDGLDQFTFGNVDRSHQSRLWAHLVLAWVFTGEFLHRRTRIYGRPLITQIAISLDWLQHSKGNDTMGVD